MSKISLNNEDVYISIDFKQMLIDDIREFFNPINKGWLFINKHMYVLLLCIASLFIVSCKEDNSRIKISSLICYDAKANEHIISLNNESYYSEYVRGYIIYDNSRKELFEIKKTSMVCKPVQSSN